MPIATSRKGKGRAQQEERPQAAIPLGKQLAHTDKKVRDRAVKSLVAFVSAGSQEEAVNGESSTGYAPLPEKEMAKLWKGLFYCYWMSDKPLVQQNLAADLAELLLLIKPKRQPGATDEEVETERFEAACGFLQGFWTAIVREWTGIDRLRMDKFYLLIRRYVNATFRLLARERWSEESVRRVNGILTAFEGPMTWENKSVASSISTHLGDIYAEELDKVLALPEVDSQPACPTLAILQPHITLLARTPTQTVHTRIMSTLITPLLTAFTLASPSIDSERPSKKVKIDQPVYAHLIMHSCIGDAGSEDRASPDELKKALLQRIFDAAAAPEAVESNRRKMYKLWREEDDE